MSFFLYAFTAGALATLNPCGFALLPATIGRFLAKGTRGWAAGLWLGLLLGLGAFLTFALIGGALSLVGTALGAYLPYLNLALGLLLIALGVLSLLGRGVGLGVGARAPRGGGPGEFFLFGLAYGLASLGCTLPIFLAVVGFAFAKGPGEGLLALLAYGSGMAGALTAIGVLVGFGKEELVRGLRRAGRWIEPLGALLLLAAGAYLAAYQLAFLLDRPGLAGWAAGASLPLGLLFYLLARRGLAKAAR